MKTIYQIVPIVLLTLFIRADVLAQTEPASKSRNPELENRQAREEAPQQKPPLKERLYFGGGFGAWFSQDFSYLELSPIVGYMISQRFSAGAGITYQYVSRTYYNSATRTDFKVSDHIYGGRLFGRAQLYGPLFAYAEFESISFNLYDPTDDTFTRTWVPGLMLGGGLMQPLGRKGGVGITVMYNVLYDDLRSPYNSPVIYRLSFFI
jgi:hypothetical protein